MPQLNIIDYLQQVAGTGLFLFALYHTKNNTLNVKKTIQNYKQYSAKSQSLLDITRFILNPNLTQNVIISNLSCKPTKNLFTKHLTFIKNPTSEYNGPSYCQSCDDFIAQTYHNNHKYAVSCIFKNTQAFVSSSLLCNLIMLQKTNINNQKLTMHSYGQLRYNKNNNQLQFEPQCFATNSQQIEDLWEQILKRRNYLYIFYGVIFGLAASLIQYQFQNIKTQFAQFQLYINNKNKIQEKLK